MANLRAIRTRIKSVENTRQITKSMKMVAAAKLRKTQAAFASLRAYADKSGELLTEASAGLSAGSNPYLIPHAEVKKVCYVLIVGNRGLCGTYNHALLRYCEQLLSESGKEAYLICCGRWGKDLIAAAGLKIDETFEVGDTPTHEEALRLADRLRQLYREGTADEIVLVYQHYKSVLSQTPESMTLLPLKREVSEEADAAERTIFEPDRDSLLDVLLDMYIGNTVHAVLLEARTGEHSARMTAMTSAADNTEELINELTLELNHARQAAITTEISEIAGGAEALRKSTAGG
ncbi:MAG: ATP synthase F1 subunit gamma [Oscillospiraceae bacterium]|nr:ATP synthase F1 subunit gamma [Oscillospiraceae bacterium]